MKKLTLITLLALSFNVFAEGVTDSDGSVTAYNPPTTSINMSPADMFAACKAADLVTTKIAMSHGAVESGKLMGPVYAKLGFTGIVGFSLLLIYGVYKLQNYYGHKADTAILIGAGLTCGVAAHNLTVN